MIPTRPGDFTHPPPIASWGTQCQELMPKKLSLSTPLKSNIDTTKIAIFERKAPFLVSMLDLGGVKICELGVLKLVLYS